MLLNEHALPTEQLVNHALHLGKLEVDKFAACGIAG